jgi:DNA-binding NarL/FixJ family response regulator
MNSRAGRCRPARFVLECRDGFEVARAVRDARLKIALVFLTMHKDEHFLNQALDLNVKGYVVKDSALTEIVQCIARSLPDRNTSARN